MGQKSTIMQMVCIILSLFFIFLTYSCLVESAFEARRNAMRTRQVKKWNERQDLCINSNQRFLNDII